MLGTVNDIVPSHTSAPADAPRKGNKKIWCACEWESVLCGDARMFGHRTQQ
jgi:hypothetical protein